MAARGVQGGSLGLPLVSKILALHGGRVEASSTLGEGTVFWFQALGPAKGGEAKPPEEKA